MGALCDTKEPHLKHGYQISQCLLDYTLGGYVNEVEEIYNIPSIDEWTDISSQKEFCTTFEGLQLKESKCLG
jgi:hypothetical protein